MSERIFGIEIEKLEKSKCYLTLHGAKVLGACSDATDVWEKKKWGKLEAKQIVHRFAYCCPACFCHQSMFDIHDRYSEASIVGARSIQFLLDACTCGEHVMTNDEKKKLILHIRAFIMHACKYRKELKTEYAELMNCPYDDI